MNMRVNIKDVENKVTELVKKGSFNNEFIYGLLLAYGKPSSSITRLKSGTYNLAKDKHTEIYWKNNLYFKYVEHEDLHSTIDDLKGDQFVARNNPRFIIVTDFKQLLSIDSKTGETLDIPIDEIDKHTVFFLPWAGMEKSAVKTENIADVRAAERMAKLYDEIIKHNDSKDPSFYHALNVFFSRLLFCFFAEDTEVFQKGQFTNSIGSHTQKDGSDLNEYLDELFQALDVEAKDNYPSHIKDFPYVNGGLFNRKLSSPVFNSQARKLILECGELDWAQINPDIFGSMIQAVVHPGQRAGLGMHYTSVVNIMKVIEPLFLEELLEELDKYYDDKIKLQKLLIRISKIKVFDPACGSGNFLIIAYKELRKLEHKIIERVNELNGDTITLFQQSSINLENFYGIEIDDFAHEVAILSLWLAKHQMNIEFKAMFNIELPLIPLRDAGNIVCGNATRIDWNKVCSNKSTKALGTYYKQSKLLDDEHEQKQLIDDEGLTQSELSEVYLIGNPPYQGSSLQDEGQKQDMQKVFLGHAGYKNLDYIACWFKKGKEYIRNTNAKLAFVSTNSLCQGEQVGLFWPDVTKDVEIGFAHTSFKWTNNAKGNAGVTCVIVSLRNTSKYPKYIFSNNIRRIAGNINPYLVDGEDLIIYKRSKPLSELPQMSYGNKAVDNGNLILSTAEKNDLIREYSSAKDFVKRYMGADELLYTKNRWCLWIPNSMLDQALSIPPIKIRIAAVKEFRLKSKKKATIEAAQRSHQFGEPRYKNAESILIPRVFSERRNYITAGYLDSNTVIADSAQLISEAEPFVFALISSRMHMAWTKAVCGQLESRIRYSSVLSYNNFPVPSLNTKQVHMLTNNALEILDVREKHPEKTLAELYDPDNMPKDLLDAHRDLDTLVDNIYRSRAFDNDEERLSYLFKLYETMTTVQKELI